MPQRYCPACGGMVETVLSDVLMGVDRAPTQLPSCSACGLELDELVEDGKLQVDGLYEPPFSLVMVAEDTAFVGKGIEETLLSSGITRYVERVEDGVQLMQRFGARAVAGQVVDLAIIDINMPNMDGLSAGRMIRGIEQQRGRSPMTMLFLSAIPCDDALRQHLTALAPAYYMNKGNLTSVSALPERMAPLLERMIHGRRSAPTP